MTTLYVLRQALSAIESDSRRGRREFTVDQAHARADAAVKLRKLIDQMESEQAPSLEAVAREFTFPSTAERVRLRLVGGQLETVR